MMNKDKEFEKLVKKLGFESKKEWHRLVANVDLSSRDKLYDFEDWKNEDGTKKGLLKL